MDYKTLDQTAQSPEITRRTFLTGLTGLLAGTMLPHELLAGSEKTISDSEINRYMRMNDAYEILKGTGVEFVQKNSHGELDLLDRIERDNKAKLVYFSSEVRTYPDSAKRASIVLRKLNENLNHLADFIFYDGDWGREFPKRFGIKTLPSSALFLPDLDKRNPWDIATGGASKDSSIKNLLENFDYWVNIAVDRSHNDFRQYKFKNTSSWQKAD